MQQPSAAAVAIGEVSPFTPLQEAKMGRDDTAERKYFHHGFSEYNRRGLDTVGRSQGLAKKNQDSDFNFRKETLGAEEISQSVD